LSTDKKETAMDFLIPDRTSGPQQFQALLSVAGAASSGLDRPQRAMVDAVQLVLFQTDLDVDISKPIAPQELALHVNDPREAQQLLRLMVATSLADGPPSLEQIERMSNFAQALGVHEPSIAVVAHLAKGRTRRFRLAFLRHSHIRQYLRNTHRIVGGLRPMARALLRVRGVVSEDAEQVARFRALADLPKDTLGHAFYHHYTDEGLRFPGEKGGFPVGALFHDFSHVLSGNDTSPEGEIRNAAFQAGFTRNDDAFFTALFAIVIHTAGVNLAPFPMPVLRGRIGQGTLARDWLLSLERGAAMKIDLGAEWDFWEDVALPLDAARKKLGVLPMRQLAEGV
jgi:tellurite resistance protein